MGILAWLFGLLGTLCAAMGIITATEVLPLLGEFPAGFTAMFWLALSAVLLLALIATALYRSSYE